MKLKTENLGDYLDELILADGEQKVMAALVSWMVTTRFDTPATKDDVTDITDGINYAFSLEKSEEEEDDE